jgi:flavin reductase (DIM6/NTAB) family NADH-FMN oxidoreductase RutF
LGYALKGGIVTTFDETVSKGMSFLTTSGAFLSTASDGKENTMTISWGFVGVIWGAPHFICAVRPQRYTKEIIDKANSFTVSVPWGGLTKELGICGSQSGRDINKGEVVKFVPGKKVDSPVVAECQTYFECEIDYVTPLDGNGLTPDVRKTMYNGDYHTLYFGKIVETYGE